MCLVVDYSEKSVKSDYLGVIICNWWRKVRKIGIFAAQNAKYTANLSEDPKKLGSSPKITQFEHFTCRIHQKLRTFDVIFQKIGKFTKLSVQLTSNLTNCGGKTPKNWNFPQNGK